MPVALPQSDHPLLLVRWVDSEVTHSGWMLLRDLEPCHPVEVATAGWEVSRTKEAVTLAQSVGGLAEHGTPQACNLITIPLCSVLEEKVLRG